MSNKANALFCAAHTVLAFVTGGLGYYWQTRLDPSLPLVPALCGLMAFGSAAWAGYYFSNINGSN